MLTQTKENYREILTVAENLYRQDPDWVTFFREVVGIEGAVRKNFPTFEELTAFEQSEEFEAIQKMLVKLREKRAAADPETEPTRVITVRLPKSMHEYLRTEAHDLRTSMNKLCISKLLQVIDEEMIPNERTGSSGKSSASSKATPSRTSTPVAASASTPITATPITATPITPTPITSTPITSTPIGQPLPQFRQPLGQQAPLPTQQQAPSPFKPTQPRF